MRTTSEPYCCPRCGSSDKIMAALGRFFWICILFIVGGWAACDITHPTRYLRYRLTVTVEDKGALKRGEGVVEFAYPSPYETFRFYGGYLSPIEMRGHPITVDLGDDGLIFVTDMSSEKTSARILPSEHQTIGWGPPNLSLLPIALYRARMNDGHSSREDIITALQGEPHEPVDVPIRYMPALMHFRTISDPNSIEEIDPADIAKTFGQGVHLISATLQLTDDSVTSVPKVWPDWLKNPDSRVQIVLNYGSKGIGRQIMNASSFAGK